MSIRVVHYLNQYFGGKGGEEKADCPLEIIEGPVGPGKLLQRELGDDAFVTTIICGDGTFEKAEGQTLEEIRRAIRGASPHVLIAGPAFASGRYGLACGAVAACAMSDCGVPAVVGMSEENPALELYRAHAYVVPSGDSVVEMPASLQRMAHLAVRLGRRESVGSPEEEGYFPRGIRRNARHRRSAEGRALDLLLEKIRMESPRTELRLSAVEVVPPPSPLANLTESTIAVVTECGVVPKGNPGRVEGVRTQKWEKYSLDGLKALSAETHESIHGGYDNTRINEDPNRGVPLDALRSLEREGFFGRLHDTYYVTCGNWGNVGVMSQIGKVIAAELKEAGIHGVLVPAT